MIKQVTEGYEAKIYTKIPLTAAPGKESTKDFLKVSSQLSYQVSRNYTLWRKSSYTEET